MFVLATSGALGCAIDNRMLSSEDADAGGSDASLSPPLTWVAIPGGSFAMGGDDSYGGDDNMPVHTVDVPSFELTQTEIAVAAYDACINAGSCQNPLDTQAYSTCTWNSGPTKQYPSLPVDCISWIEAHQFCHWVGGRLPTEAEWEYAARSAGQATTYPWGNAAPTCKQAANDVAGCFLSFPDPPCSHPDGNTAQGLCDMAGNVWEVIEDAWSSSGYTGAPTDGSAQETGAPAGPDGQPRVQRGGGFNDGATDGLRNAYRSHFPENAAGYTLGIRCARSATP